MPNPTAHSESPENPQIKFKNQNKYSKIGEFAPHRGKLGALKGKLGSQTRVWFSGRFLRDGWCYITANFACSLAKIMSHARATLSPRPGHPLRTGQLPGKLYPGNWAIFRNRSFFFQILTENFCLPGHESLTGRLWFWKITIFLFVDVALRAASILKNHDFLYLLIVLHIAKQPYLLWFEHQECLRTLSFEKCCRLH